MKFGVKALALCLLAVIFSYSMTQADELGFLEIKNDVQLEVVKTVLDHAYTKVDNKFLVSYTSEQKSMLTQSGIGLETVVADADIDAYYLFYPDRKLDEEVVRSKFDDLIDLGAGLKISKVNNLALSDPLLIGYKAVPLSDQHIFFHTTDTYVSLTSILGDKSIFPTDTLANYIDMDTLIDNLTRLRDFYTRYILTDSIDRARDWIMSKYQSWGYTDVQVETFNYNFDTHYNVYAVKQGYAEPDKVIVIGGHYDSITYNQPTTAEQFAPGADDNGTGTVLAMEMARVLANVPTRKTIIFYAFSAEEVGLVGARAAAYNFAQAGTDIEVMFNYDMVAHNPSPDWLLDINLDPKDYAYSEMTGDCAYRLTDITPVYTSLETSSDHYGFYEQGYKVVNNIEDDFNYTGWHTDVDEINILNMPYYTDVNKMAIAALAIVANSTTPPAQVNVLDVGDGQSLHVSWVECNPNYNYTISYRNETAGTPYQSVAVPFGDCDYTLEGLVQDAEYSIAVYGEEAGAYPPVSVPEETMSPMVVPRTPTAFAANPELNSVVIQWAPNKELDLSHYRIYRDDGGGYQLLADNLTDTEYIDGDVVGQLTYGYKISAVDNDMNESVLSDESQSIAATFDAGILLVDDMNIYNPMPNQTVQDAFFQYLMDGTPYTQKSVNDPETVLKRNEAGQYSSIFWIDDDLTPKLIEYSEDSISWYLNYTDNMFICGMRTVRYWSASDVPTDHILYTDFKISYQTEIGASDFTGATGHNGWPSVNMDPTSFFGSKLPAVTIMETLPEGEVIYTYNSFSGDANQANKPCGVLYEDPNGGKRVVLGFPLYYLNDADAQKIIRYAKYLFGEDSYDYVFGDVVDDGLFDIDDLVFTVDYQFRGGEAPTNKNAMDVDGSCEIDIGDLVYMVDYQFRGSGIPPGPGCVE